MANEINVRMGLSINKNNSVISGVADNKYDLVGDERFAGVQVISTAGEGINFPADLVAAGVTFIWVKNLSTTQTIEISNGMTLKPGEGTLFRSTTGPGVDPALTATAIGAPADLEIIAAGT